MTRPIRSTPEDLMAGLDALPKVLSDMGFKSLRPAQETPVLQLLSGRDVFAILPTGGGKTLIHACVTKALGKHNVVFSPLVALMADQVEAMTRMGLRCAAINSSQPDALNRTALAEWADGAIDTLLVAPERMENEQFMNAMRLCKPTMVTVDEAHCLSIYAAVFRSSYTKVGNFIDEFNPDLVLAITATATNNIVRDVKKICRIENCALCKNFVPRDNIKLHSVWFNAPYSRYGRDKELERSMLSKTRKLIEETDGSCIVYCSTVSDVEMVTKFLTQVGISTTFYHGQITNDVFKRSNQEDFMKDRAKVIVATNAFGMGIDKPDIRLIVHFTPPGSVEAIAQETGRASRDGKIAHCWMFNYPGATGVQSFLAGKSNPTGNDVRKVFRYLDRIKDADGNVYETVANMEKTTGVETVSGALSILSNFECIERYENATKVFKILIGQNTVSEDMSPTRKAILDVVKEDGVFEKATGDHGRLYSIDMNLIVKKLAKVETTIMTHLRQLQKEGKIDLFPPFRGKVTRVLKDPSEEEYAWADEWRDAEMGKIQDIEKYLKTPDEQKTKFLTDYFKLDEEGRQ